MLCPIKCADMAAYKNNEGATYDANDGAKEEIGPVWSYPGSAELLSGVCCVTAV